MRPHRCGPSASLTIASHSASTASASRKNFCCTCTMKCRFFQRSAASGSNMRPSKNRSADRIICPRSDATAVGCSRLPSSFDDAPGKSAPASRRCSRYRSDRNTAMARAADLNRRSPTAPSAPRHAPHPAQAPAPSPPASGPAYAQRRPVPSPAYRAASPRIWRGETATPIPLPAQNRAPAPRSAGRVGQRDESDIKGCQAHPSSPAAMTSACATSTTLRFWSIAVLRSRL